MSKDKLNVYDEGNYFKPHFDTPGSEGIFAMLVVCLPRPHTGGELVIRQGSATAATNWAALSQSNVVQWVACYSDCLHDVR